MAFVETVRDVIVFTETWLDDTIPSSLISDNAYTIYRCDRNSDNNERTRGGGVLIACSAKLNTSAVTHSFSSLELAWTRIKMTNTSLFIGVIYIPSYQRNNRLILQSLHESVSFIMERMNEQDLLLLMGDFNSPSLSWNASPVDKNCFIPASTSVQRGLFPDCLENGLDLSYL